MTKTILHHPPGGVAPGGKKGRYDVRRKHVHKDL